MNLISKTAFKEHLLASSASRFSKLGVLTTGQAKEQMMQLQRITTISMYTESGETWFFTDDHCFGVNLLPSSFVPCSASLPMKITPREGFESGVIDTLEKYVSIFHKGKQLTNIDEVVDLSIEELQKEKMILYQERKKPRQGYSKYSPQFFPEGTLVEIDCFGSNKGTYTVNTIVKNGANSYVLVMKERQEDTSPIEYHSYHTSHVTRIISRGTGKVVIQDTWDSGKKSFLEAPHTYGNKGSYYRYPHSVIMHLSEVLNINRELCVDGERMAQCVIANCGKPVKGSHHSFYSFNKKKTKKWFKQNFNKFLVSPVDAQASEDNYMNNLLQEDYPPL